MFLGYGKVSTGGVKRWDCFEHLMNKETDSLKAHILVLRREYGPNQKKDIDRRPGITMKGNGRCKEGLRALARITGPAEIIPFPTMQNTNY